MSLTQGRDAGLRKGMQICVGRVHVDLEEPSDVWGVMARGEEQERFCTAALPGP
jgi:hypothetical protein